jgi:flagellar protein FliS
MSNTQEYSQEELLLMLYSGAIKFCDEAKEALNNQNIELFNSKLKKIQAIINELMVTLDVKQGGEIAENLYNLYEYINRRLIQANIRKDITILEEVSVLLIDLKEGWEKVVNSGFSDKEGRS